jgi:hypothetical protein
VLSPYVLAELDYHLLKPRGIDGELHFPADVAAGAFELATFNRSDIARAMPVLTKYRDLWVGPAGASPVVLAERYGTTRLLTLDERHFRAIQPLHADSFTRLPAHPDEPLADQLLGKAPAEGVELLGPDGLLSQVTRAVLERALGEEMTAHLGYEKHDPAGRGLR